MFRECVTSPDKAQQVASTLKTIEKGMAQYLAVARRMGAKNVQNFAYILGAIHWKEASCDFRGVLHNGEKIVGTNLKTKLVPKGRGPFATWEDAAVDAIGIESKKWKVLLGGSDDVGDILYALERYNGTGYISGAGKRDVSPYLWENSNISDGTGKYVSDGKYDADRKLGATAGAAVILKEAYRQGAFDVRV